MSAAAQIRKFDGLSAASELISNMRNSIRHPECCRIASTDEASRQAKGMFITLLCCVF
jgi:hypothetical protein